MTEPRPPRRRARLAIVATCVGFVLLAASGILVAIVKMNASSASGIGITIEPVPTEGGASGSPSGAPSASPGSPTPSVSALPTPSAKPGARASTGVAAKPPPPAGFPNASNTGVSSGVALTKSGTISVKQAGAVISGYDVAGTIDVAANNVVIRNVRITNSSKADWGIIQRDGFSGLLVENSDIIGNGKQEMQAGIQNFGGPLTVRRTDISRISDGVATIQGVIEDSYLHDPTDFDSAHVDMIQATSGPPSNGSLTIRRNTIINTLAQTSAIALFQDFGVARNTLVEANMIAGGGWSIYGGYGPEKSYNIRIINNVFGRQVFPNCGNNGPVAYFDKNGSGNQFSGNVWQDTGAAVTA